MRESRASGQGQVAEEIAALYDVERVPMLGLATLMVGSSHLAEEVVHDAFAQIATRWAELDNPGGYLRTTVVNGCNSLLRRRATQRRLDPPTAVIPSEAPTELVELYEALATLPMRQRSVLVCRYLIDLPDDEIAASLGCTSSTVRSLAHRGLHALQKELS